MKFSILLVLMLSVGCSSTSKKDQEIPEGYVSESVAIQLMGKSFFVGCMTVLHDRGFKSVAEECQKLSKDHAEEIRGIVEQR
ncbi:MAG TPA: hypothetical protein DCY86_05040 [Bdellovibrionales bacterium]|nr:hypothetical protein [Bdellovibrionales bacterium]